jgi:hypothetical protein
MPEKNDPVRVWVLENPNAQTLIAEFFGVSISHVGKVLRRKVFSDRGRIEGVLADLGAPGMRERQREAANRPREINKTAREKKRLMDQLKRIRNERTRGAA